MYIVANAVVVEAGSSVTCSRVVHRLLFYTTSIIDKLARTDRAKHGNPEGIYNPPTSVCVGSSPTLPTLFAWPRGLRRFPAKEVCA